jgi:hypothetical protein
MSTYLDNIAETICTVPTSEHHAFYITGRGGIEW